MCCVAASQVRSMSTSTAARSRRRAVGIVSWDHAQLLFGQESPLVAERSPRSLASVGFPDFAGAGNLWLWLPQFRVTAEGGYTLRVAVQVAVLAPTAGAALRTVRDPARFGRTEPPPLPGGPGAARLGAD